MPENTNEIKKLTDLNHYYRIAEDCIAQLGIDPATVRNEQMLGQWLLKKGSAQIIVDIWQPKDQDIAYFQAASPVMEVPAGANMSTLGEHLLTMNHSLFGPMFSIFNNIVWLKYMRNLQGLDPSEALSIISLVGNYADALDDELIEKFERQKPVGFQMSSRA